MIGARWGFVAWLVFGLLALSLSARAAGVATVTSLADSGPGSLREAVASGAPVVRFALPCAGGCTYELLTPLRLHSSLLLDGFGSPSSVTIRHAQPQYAPALDLNGVTDVTIRGITIRAPKVHPDDANHDCVRIWRSSRVTLWRMTCAEAEDEGVEIAHSQDVSVLESRFVGRTAKGYCALVYGESTDRVLFLRNVFEGCSARTPLVITGRRVAVVNNLMRGTRGWGLAVQAYDYGVTPSPTAQVDFEANLVETTDWWNPWLHVGGNQWTPSPGTMSVYLRGNVSSTRLSALQDEWTGVDVLTGTLVRRTRRAWDHGAVVVPAAELGSLAAGAP